MTIRLFVLATLTASLSLAACDPLPGSPLASSSAVATVSATAVATASASAAPNPAEVVLATVNGRNITRGELDFWLMGSRGRRATAEARQQALDELIEAELLYQRGVELGLDHDPKYRASVRDFELRLAAAKRKEMVRRIGNVEIVTKVQVTVADAKAYFEQHEATITAEYHLGAITFPSVKAAQQALDEIKGGKSFEEIADRSSPRQPKKPEAVAAAKPIWDLGWLAWNQMPVEWAAAVGPMKSGDVSAVVHGARVGIRIFKLLKKRPNEKASFQTVQGVITNRLRDERVEAFKKKYVGELKSKAKIVRSDAPLAAPAPVKPPRRGRR